MNDQRKALANAQRKARNGDKLTRTDIKLLRIEADRLQALAMTRD